MAARQHDWQVGDRVRWKTSFREFRDGSTVASITSSGDYGPGGDCHYVRVLNEAFGHAWTCFDRVEPEFGPW